MGIAYSYRLQTTALATDAPMVIHKEIAKTSVKPGTAPVEPSLTTIDHIAIQVTDLATTVAWYQQNFHCTVSYADESWAMLEFANLKLALVVSHQHPSHIAFKHPHPQTYGNLKQHRDGSRSVYITNPAGNSIELVAID